MILTEDAEVMLRGGIGRWTLVGGIFTLGGGVRSFLINISAKKNDRNLCKKKS